MIDGTLVDFDGRPAVRFQRTFPYPPQRLWRAVTEPDELAHWFPSRVQLEPRAGGRVEFSGDPNLPPASGSVLVYEPPRRLAFTWGPDQLHFELDRVDPDACRLTLINVLGERQAAARNAAGWNLCLAEPRHLPRRRRRRRPRHRHGHLVAPLRRVRRRGSAIWRAHPGPTAGFPHVVRPSRCAPRFVTLPGTMPDRNRRWAALGLVCLASLMIVLDATIVNVALPAIQRDLGFAQTDLAWVVNAYLLTFGGCMLIAGRAADLFGRRRVLMGGIALFTAASLACGLASSQAFIVVARAIQGIGGATVSAVSLSIVLVLFVEQADRAKAMSTGVSSARVAAGGVIAGGLPRRA